jgi:NAD(P)-dependent dehydrogenase (short-subunit alcohol dehydrogenase family)
MMSFDGRCAVVTGAGSGIGKATARMLAERGARVVAADLREEGLADLDGVERVVCDITSADDRARLVATAGPTHHLVNAAGVIRMRPLDAIAESDWDFMFDVNVKACFFVCQAFAPVLVDGVGSIVNLSSVAGRYAATLENTVYAATKAAVLSLTRSLAYNLGPRGIRANAVLPGIIETPMQERVLGELAALRGTTAESMGAARLAGVPLRRTATPEECAEAILALLGPSGSYITGQGVGVDGGYFMAP